jgi:hypothetical protein
MIDTPFLEMFDAHHLFSHSPESRLSRPCPPLETKHQDIMSNPDSSSPAKDDFSSSSSSSSDIPQFDDRIVAAAKSALWDALAQGVANVIANMNSSWYGTHAVYYSREKEALERKYVPPFQCGVAATLALFVGFRVTGNPGFQTWRRSAWQRYMVGPPKSTPTNNVPSAVHDLGVGKSATQRLRAPAPPSMGYLERTRQAEVERALKSMKFLTDFLVSLSVGTSGTLFLLEAKKDTMRRDLEDAPLVPGKSLVADQLCPGLLQLSRGDSSVEQALTLPTARIQEDPMLTTFVTLIGNCRKRADYEDRTRKEEGREKDALILVPHTGL